VCQECRRKNDADYYSIRDSACISDKQYGILASIAFTICFALSSIIAGRIADYLRGSRILHAGAALIWSLAAFAVVPNPNFTVLIISRIILGIAQGFNAPCAYPVIAYFFSHNGDHRALANGVYSIGTYLGSALSSLSLVLTMIFGWRTIATIAAIFGVFCAALIYLFVDRPPPPILKNNDSFIFQSLSYQSLSSWREGFSHENPSCYDHLDNDDQLYSSEYTRRICPDTSPLTSCALCMHVITIPKRLWLLYATTSVRMIVTVSIWSYLPIYFSRAFPMRLAIFSILYALGTLFFGSISSALGGAIADWIVKRTARGSVGHALVPLFGTVFSAILSIIALNATKFRSAITAAIFAILIGECWLGPCMTLLARDVEPSTMGTHVALLLVCNQLAAGLGPWIISLADDGSTGGLRTPFLAVLSTGSALATLGLLALAFSHRSDTSSKGYIRPPPRQRRMSPPDFHGTMDEIQTLTAARFQRSSSNDTGAVSPSAIFQRSSSNGERVSSPKTHGKVQRNEYFSYPIIGGGGDVALSATRTVRSPRRSQYRELSQHDSASAAADELRSLLKDVPSSVSKIANGEGSLSTRQPGDSLF